MFEITGDDVSLLGDADLRTLIGLLSEAELRRRGLPTSAATWGGEQTAKDGGLDVRISLPTGTSIEGFIPNPQSGFQVKTPDMPRGKILDEMKPAPQHVLRPVIIELGSAAGAYIIVSSTGSTSDTALTSRRDAMTEAVKGSPVEGKLTLDFYDRNRIATWVRDHAGLIPWVRSRIGKAVPGWQSFGSWSHVPNGVDASFLTDEQARIRTGAKDDGDGVSTIDGINRIRKVLSVPGQVVRLVGLSGVGKTRLAEALFDTTIGEGPLDSSLAIYTNIADQPNPAPTGLSSDLIAGQTRAILVVDNCPPELHRQLSEIARSQRSTISVLTIEYDIREDQPEGTDVFALDVSSTQLIEKLVERRYPNLSVIDARTIANFSGGNARIAIALASRIEASETVAALGDEELFKRLFQQRHDPDPSLLLIAQACSLAYSFEGEKLDGEDAELSLLGGLIGKTADEVYRGAAALKQRDLLQARAQWRAVLPHAIANRLAKMALRTFPVARVQTSLLDKAPERLLRSFSRRLGYLDDSKEAQGIVRGWLAPGGLLHDVVSLNDIGRQFHIILSGTHAPIDTRVRVAEGLLRSGDKTMRALGVMALQALMKVSHFSSVHEFAFGARSRNYGFLPRGDEARDWFKAVLKLASKFAISQEPVTNEVRHAIAVEFQGLYWDTGCAEQLDELVRGIATQSFWPEGWIAARKAFTYDRTGLKQDLRTRLSALEEFLRPKDLESKVRGLVIGGRNGSLDLRDIDVEEEEDSTNVDYEARAARSNAVVVDLGQQVALNEAVLKELLPELVVSDDPRVVTFGEALAEATDDVRATWDIIVAQFAATKTSLGLVIGFLKGLQKRDAALADAILDEALEGEPIGQWFPLLQVRLKIDAPALARFQRALILGKAGITTFYNLAVGRVTADIPGPAFRDLVTAIAGVPGGSRVALRITSMRLYSDRVDKNARQAEVLDAGRIVLAGFQFDGKSLNHSEDHDIGVVVRASLAGPNDALEAQNLCQKLLAAVARRDIQLQNYDDLMRALLEVHPSDVLDVLFPSDAKARRNGVDLIRNFRLFRHAVLDVVPDETLVAWCDRDPAVRYPLAASTVTLFRRAEKGKPLEWAPVTAMLLEKAPDANLVLDEIVKRLYPTSWSGSLATKLEEGLRLLNSLPSAQASALAGALAKAKLDMQSSIEAERRSEMEDDRADNNRFEWQ